MKKAARDKQAADSLFLMQYTSEAYSIFRNRL